MKAVILKKNAGHNLKENGLWVFAPEIETYDDNISDGSLVEVYSINKHFYGIGFYNSKSQIRVRLLTKKREIIDDNFFYNRLNDAWQYRKKVIDTSSCRIIFGDADLLSGFTVDKYENILVFEALALGIDLNKEKLIRMLIDILAKDNIHIRAVLERSDAKVREKEGLARIKAWFINEADNIIRINENGLKLDIDIFNGQKTGYFLDQKENRAAIKKYMHNKTVLDCFCNVGGFALNAAKAGAKQAIGIDQSGQAVEYANHNAKINNLYPCAYFKQADVFEYLRLLKQQQKKFDAVILDPPAFTKSISSLKKAIGGYRDINMQALQIINNGGFLISSSCSQFLDEETFKKIIAQAAGATHKRLRQVEFRTQAGDHPIIWNYKNTYYLKFVILEVENE